MRSTIITATIAAIATLGAATISVADDGGARFTATLDGASEAPGPGDPDGSGTATIRVNPGQREICYSITVNNIAAATAAHIHEAPAGSAGPVVVTLGAPTNGTSQGCATVTRELAKEIMRAPADYYVNVHNAEFMPGAVRGQLSK